MFRIPLTSRPIQRIAAVALGAMLFTAQMLAQTTTTTTTTPAGSSADPTAPTVTSQSYGAMTKGEIKQQHKQQKREEKSANDNAKAAKANAKARKANNKALQSQEKAGYQNPTTTTDSSPNTH